MVKPLRSPSSQEVNRWNFEKLFRHLELSAEAGYTVALAACAMAFTAIVLAIIAIAR